MLLGSVFSIQYLTEAVATACYTQNRYSLISKAFGIFNTRRQQTEETYHITFDESTNAIKFTKPSVDNITIAESERYPPDEYLHPYEPSQRYQVNSNDISSIEPYEEPELVVLETNHSNHNNDEPILENLPNTEDVQTSKPLSSPAKDASVPNTNLILTNPFLSISSMASLAPQYKWSQDKHIELVNIIGNLRAGMLTRALAKELSAASAHECLFVDFLSKEEPKKVSEALKHPGWVDAMQEELNQFSRKKTQGYNQQEYIDYDETFAPVARVEAIRIFLAFATYINFTVYQMDVKSAFLNEKLKEKVYVKQPLGFESSEFPNHVCKLDKALLGLKQAPKAWYETLSAFLTKHKFVRGKIDNTLFIKQTVRGISINQEKYVKDMLNKNDINGSLVKTTMVSPNNLGPDLNGKVVNKTQYKGFDLKGYSDSDYIRYNMDKKITSGDIELHFVPTQYQLADIFTKPLNEPTFKRLICELVLKETNRVWFSTPTGGIIGEVGLTSFRNAIGANYLAHSRQYVEPPSMKIIGEWFSSIGYSGEIKANGLKKNQPKGLPFTTHILAICNAKEPVAFEAPNTYVYNRKKVPKGKKSGAKTGHRNKSTSLLTKNNTMSKIEATKGGSSSKETTGSPTGHSKKRESSLAKDQNPSQPSASTPVVARLHKEAQQTTHGPTSLGVTSEEGANPQLNSGISASIYTKPIYSASTITHSKSTSEHDILASSKAGADYGLSAPKDSVSQTTSNDKGPNKLSLDHILTGASNIAKEIKDEFNTSPDLSSSDDTQKDIKLKDLSKLIQNVGVNFIDLDSPKDDQPIIIEDEEEEDDDTKDDSEKVQPKQSKETKDTSAAHPLSLNSLPTKLKELPSKFNELTGEVKELKKHVHDLEIEIPRDLEEIPNKLETFTSTVKSLTTQVA
ncbi:retrovirus-related pol polyprotein from transposon TNT 1-94 [Tanacetum coccineum]